MKINSLAQNKVQMGDYLTGINNYSFSCAIKSIE
jgi:hypothetical protein